MLSKIIIARTSILSTSDEQFAHKLLEKCVEWDLQIGNEDSWHDQVWSFQSHISQVFVTTKTCIIQTDIQMFASDLREYAWYVLLPIKPTVRH
jgi:hypothetical protein